MGHIKEYYEQIFQLSEQEWQFIAKHFTYTEYAKHSIITDVEEVEQYLYFIEKGIVRFYIPGEEQDLTFNFCFDKKFTCAYDSFLSQEPSAYVLQALTDCKVWKISHSDLQMIYTRTIAGQYLGRFVAEQMYRDKSKRELSLLKYNAKERYLNLFEEQPEIVKYIPLKYIASYIGITPQALSRIRRQVN